MITIIWKKSVNATDSMPPEQRLDEHDATPMIIPSRGSTAPSVSTENTSPSAVICADTQPR